MASRIEILAFAHELLDLDAFPDYGPMGLQVAGADEVAKIACGVSASLELFHHAAAVGAQLVIVHHGLFWDNESRVVDTMLKRRLKALFDADMTLAAYHLALDAHPELGNNARLAQELGVEIDGPFGTVGLGGRLRAPESGDAFARRVAALLRREPIAFTYGPETVERVAICSGGAGRELPRAAAEGYDLFLSGEPEEPSLHQAKELGIHFVAAGHYASERLGVQALSARLAERFDLEWVFIELTNPV
jgi:dinuclear metal center YbgI/SA1388 family protein